MSLEKLFRPSARVGLGRSFFFYFSVCHLRNTSMSVSSPGRLHTRTVWKTTRRSTLKAPPPTNTTPFPFTPPTLGGKATEPPALSHLAGFREPFKVKPAGDYCLCRARFFFSIPRLSSPLLSTITRRHKIRRLLTASDRGCIQRRLYYFSTPAQPKLR